MKIQWYYANEGKQKGPLGDDEFNDLIAKGEIHSETLVWKSGMAGWQPLEKAMEKEAVENNQSSSTPFCAECKSVFPEEEMIKVKGQWVCAACKPLVLQKIREGVRLHGVLNYAGFWIRFVAKFIDGLILGFFNVILSVISGFAVASTGTGTTGPIVIQSLALLLQIALSAGYTTYFLGKHGATPGKMACGLKVVRDDGSSLSYGLGFGRYLAEIISQVTLTIGYIIAAFDSEKRALHDHICSTRVVKR